MKSNPQLLESFEQLNIGDVLLRRKLLVMHVGIYLGEDCVLHSSPSKGQQKTSLDMFRKGGEVFFVSPNLPGDKILINVDKLLNEKQDYQHEIGRNKSPHRLLHD